MREWTRPATAVTALRVPRPRIALAWLLPVAGPTLLLALFLGLAGPSFVTQDTWLALASGREIVEHGLPHVNHLTAVGGGTRWVDQQWLGDLLFYGASRLGGMAAVNALWLVAVLCGFALAAGVASRRGASPMVLLGAFALCAAAAPWGMQSRTQVFALPLFSLILFLLLRDPDAHRRSTLWVLPSLCLWANIHGSAALGALVVFAYGLQALVRHAPRAVALCCLASPATLFASPYAADLPGYYRLMLLNPPFGRSVAEWQRTMPSGVTAIFFLLAFASLAIAARSRRRFSVLDVLILGMTLAIALDALRGVIWFSLAALAIVPSAVTERASRQKESSGAGLLAAMLIVLTLGSIVWAAGRPADGYGGRFPQTVLTAIRQRGSQPIYTDLRSGDWLLWEVPSLRGRISYDIRLEVLNRRQFNEIVDYTRFRPGWRNQLKGYRLGVVDEAHGNRLARGGGWKTIYSNGTLAVVGRRPL
jgi:hypothetical protein